MTAYAVTDWYVEEPNIADCLAALETKIETIDDTKTIRLVGIDRRGNTWTAYLVYDA